MTCELKHKTKTNNSTLKPILETTKIVCNKLKYTFTTRGQTIKAGCLTSVISANKIYDHRRSVWARIMNIEPRLFDLSLSLVGCWWKKRRLFIVFISKQCVARALNACGAVRDPIELNFIAVRWNAWDVCEDFFFCHSGCLKKTALIVVCPVVFLRSKYVLNLRCSDNFCIHYFVRV